MAFKPFIVAVLMVIAVSCLTVFVPFAFADGNLSNNPSNNPSNQSLNQPSVLVAPEPDFEINVYSKPRTDKKRIGYGLGGDRVTVLERVGSNEGYTWNYVQFSSSPTLKGWIREDFVTSEVQKSLRYPSGGRQRSGLQSDRGFQLDRGYWSDRPNQQPYRQPSYRGNQQQVDYGQQQNH